MLGHWSTYIVQSNHQHPDVPAWALAIVSVDFDTGTILRARYGVCGPITDKTLRSMAKIHMAGFTTETKI